jgi:hypothetical protein
MGQERRLRHPIYSLLPAEIEGFDSLAELALDMVWSWNHRTDTIWRQLDSALWEFTQNPWVVLQTVSLERLERVLADPAFRRQVDDMIQARRSRDNTPTWFQEHHAASRLTRVAYFSMEFMLSEALPIYSGGLGNVAGDQLKAASDLGFRSWVSGFSTSRDISGRPSIKWGRSTLFFHTTIPDNFPLLLCASRMENGCAYESPCRDIRSGCAPGRSRSEE